MTKQVKLVDVGSIRTDLEEALRHIMAFGNSGDVRLPHQAIKPLERIQEQLDGVLDLDSIKDVAEPPAWTTDEILAREG